jgi:nucleotide-binding universal stress UspA family protein
MYQRILIPLDGSNIAERALPLAASLARQSGAKLILTRSVYLTGVTAETFNVAQHNALCKADAYLKNIAAPLRAKGLSVDLAINYAEPAEGILSEIDVTDADLVIMTTHGWTGFRRLVFGSVAEAVLAHSPVPVMLVRAAPDAAPLTLDQPHPTLLVPLDGSTFAEEALPHAMALAQAVEGEIVLLHVYEPPDIVPAHIYTKTDSIGQKLTQGQEHVEAYMSGIAHHLREIGLAVRTKIDGGDVIQAILEEGWNANASAVVMATHGRTGLGRALYGSVAQDVLRYGSLPVMLVRPADFIAEREPTQEETLLPA